MSRELLLSVHFHDGRYHGTGGWPPSPFRLFQALVAGSAAGGHILGDDKEALVWLESLRAPIIAAPIVHPGRGFTNFVPNNDLDAVGNNPRRVGETRVGKIIRPLIFDAAIPLLYIWTFSEADEAQAEAVCAIARKLYQLGRGVDMAWASGECLDTKAVDLRLARYAGVIHRPGNEFGKQLQSPMRGSLASLIKRFVAMQRRFSRESTKPLFIQPPKPRSATVFYDSPPRRFLFDLRDSTEQSNFAPWPITDAASFVDHLRKNAAKRLKSFLSSAGESIERVFIGRDAVETDKAARLKVIPLPSIGHEHADHAIRRVLVEVPDNCPLAPEDIRWAFSGLVAASDSRTGEVLSLLVPAQDEDMLWYFGAMSGHRVWRTVTPAILPQPAARRRIDPDRINDRTEQKDAAERHREEARAAAAVAQALRHAQIDAEMAKVRVQREPFDRKGARAEAFAPGTRFAKERLWHVEIALTKPVRGPLVLGDGRYLGLGLFAPVRERRAVLSFALGGGKPVPGHEALIARAARRAVMARVQERLRRGETLPSFFSGHEADGAPNRSGHHAHLFYAVDLVGEPARLLILAPHIVEHRKAEAEEEKNLRLLGDALEDFSFLRAGKAGLFTLAPSSAALEDDPYCGLSRKWISATSYRPTRHPKRKVDVGEALIADVLAECARRGLARPKEVNVISRETGPRGAIRALLRLDFVGLVQGPVLLGSDAHEGGGTFRSAEVRRPVNGEL